MKRKDSPSRLVAIDLILRTFMNTSGFNEMEPKNWNAISRLIPGSTAQECMKRFENLKQNAKSFSSKGNSLSLAAEGRSALKPASNSTTNTAGPRLVETDHQLEIHETADVSNKQEQDEKPQEKAMNSHHYGKSPNMVIHVCDEAKNVKKDFMCPRDLLVVEMKYFAEYLSNEVQRWEDVDISVHCDVQIFDWLMSYVKRDLPEFKDNVPPTLEAGNVISILISSDFLKMDRLVEDCIQFCHGNMSNIISTPCNMNCINDKLCTRITALFTDCEVDVIKDKKDKFKSKLFVKKIETLLGPGGPGSTLFRCQFCKRLLTKETMQTLRCLSNRISIGKKGGKTYYHKRDTGWDVNDHLLSLKKELKTWRSVYWRLWGSVSCLECTQCKQKFPCCEFQNCCIHPEKANFIYPGLQSSAVGTYGCCNKKATRFEYLIENQGCEVRDHVISAHKENQSEVPSLESRLFEILQSKKDIICTPVKPQDHCRSGGIDIFKGDDSLSSLSENSLALHSSGHYIEAINTNSEVDMREYSSDDFDSSDDEMGDDEQSRSGKSKAKRKVTKKTSKQITSASSSVSGSKSRTGQKWDSHQSLRWNQDAQREHDRYRLDELTQHLIKRRQDSYIEAHEKTKRKEYPGGLFNRLEVQFKSNLNISRPNNVPVQPRPKMRLGQVRAT